jgi:hypothetical protein
MRLKLGVHFMWRQLLTVRTTDTAGTKRRSCKYWAVVVCLTAAQLRQLKRDVDRRSPGTSALSALHAALHARVYVEACMADGRPCKASGMVLWVVDRDTLDAALKAPELSRELTLYIVRSSVPCSERPASGHSKDAKDTQRQRLRLRLVVYFVHAEGTVDGAVSKPFDMHMKQVLPATLCIDKDASSFRWSELLKLAHDACAAARAQKRACFADVKTSLSVIAESDEVADADADVCMTQNGGRRWSSKLMTFLNDIRVKLLTASNAVAVAEASLATLRNMEQAVRVCQESPHKDVMFEQQQSAAFFVKLVCATRTALCNACRGVTERTHFTAALPETMKPLAPTVLRGAPVLVPLRRAPPLPMPLAMPLPPTVMPAAAAAAAAVTKQ